MPIVTVDLQEGFEKDKVHILVDDARVFEQSGIKTRPEIGFAARTTLDLKSGEHRVIVKLPDRNLEGQIRMDPSKNAYLGVSVENGSLKLMPSAQMFGYL